MLIFGYCKNAKVAIIHLKLTEWNSQDKDEHDDNVAPNSKGLIVKSNSATKFERLVSAPTKNRGCKNKKHIIFRKMKSGLNKSGTICCVFWWAKKCLLFAGWNQILGYFQIYLLEKTQCIPTLPGGRTESSVQTLLTQKL